MNNKVAVRTCTEYNIHEISKNLSEIYQITGGPDVRGKKVLIKPNILSDSDPARCICTNPLIVKAMILFLREKGASVYVGDSPAVHFQSFKGEKSGIRKVCTETGATWVDFTEDPIEIKIGKSKIKVASAVKMVDLIISLPKFKNHELVYFTGAIKNTLGIVPGFNKAKQHALYFDRTRFSEFLTDLNEVITPDYFFMDAISGMEGQGPAKGDPVHIGLLLGSTNPLALDIVASKIACYDPLTVPTTKIALSRKKWLTSVADIEYDGPDPATIIKRDFRKIPVTGTDNITYQFLRKRIRILRKIERRPVFDNNNCTGCHKCTSICPVEAIKPEKSDKTKIILTDEKCIRCFCCSEVCLDNAIEVRRKMFGT